VQLPAEEDTQSEMAEQELRERGRTGRGERQTAEELGARVEERPLFLPKTSTASTEEEWKPRSFVLSFAISFVVSLVRHIFPRVGLAISRPGHPETYPGPDYGR